MKRLLIYGLSAGIFLSVFLIVAGCSRPMMGGYPYSPGSAGPGGSYSSNGQRIYFTSSSSSGESISYSNGPSTMMQGSLACVNCHGQNGKGGRVAFKMQSFDVPDITWPELTADDPPYTEETLKRAIIQGIDPAGDPLKYPMPRWQISDPDLNDLAGFIKTLK
jgi:cytochrome c oxidase subunit 2